MTRTTPPRPVDIAAVFPALVPLARTVTRLHPRPGTPSPNDSSVGGPLLWPAAEPWPHCNARHEVQIEPPGSPAEVRQRRRDRAEARNRPPEPYVPPQPAIIDLVAFTRALPPGPTSMLPVAQLFARDVPGLRPPGEKDLLQVLWCPFDHDEDNEPWPRTALYWRSSATVTDILVDPPEPPVVQYDDYVPEQCVVHPEQVIEYPSSAELDGELRDRIDQLTAGQLGAELDSFQDDDIRYSQDLSVVPGWKVGGWIGWGYTDPYPQPCPTCRTPTEPLLTIAWKEWGGAHSWIPYDDWAAVAGGVEFPSPNQPTMVCVAGGRNLIIRVCPASPEHPHVTLIQ